MADTQIQRNGRKLKLVANPDAPAAKARTARENAAARLATVKNAGAAQKIDALVLLVEDLLKRIEALEQRR